jgi:hypothetical protein
MMATKTARQEDATGPAGQGEYQRFGHELTDHARAAGTERQSDRKLVTPRRTLCGQQAREIRAADKQEHDGHAGQHTNHLNLRRVGCDAARMGDRDAAVLAFSAR